MTALGFMMMTGSITGFSVSGIPNVPEVIEVRETLPMKDKKIVIARSMTVEEYVKNYFSDIPILVEVARCESRFRQHDSSGQVLRGEKNNLDRGVMQINEYYHNLDSEKLGYDILSIEGNTSYARHLFEKQGLRPWKSSSPCWSKSIAYANYMQKELAMK